MARNYSSSEASEIGRWHLKLLSRLQSASTSSPEGYRADTRTALSELTSSGYFEKSFLAEAIDDISPLSDKAGLSKIVTSIYRYKRFAELTRACATLLDSHKTEIERLLEEIEPAYRGFTWSFLPARTKVVAESACARLKELKETQYPTNAMALLDEIEKLHNVNPDQAWDDFLDDRGGYRRVLQECAAGSIAAGHSVKSNEKLIREAGNLSRCLADIKHASSTMIPEAKGATDAMVAKRVTDMLDSTPIEDITRQKPGIRAKVLRDCGYETIGRLCGLSAAEISGAPGLDGGLQAMS